MIGTNTIHPPLLPLPPRKPRPVPPLKRPVKASMIVAAMKARRPR